MSSLHGAPDLPFSVMVQDTIKTHGLRWAVRYYCFKHNIPSKQFRIFAGI